MSMTPSRAKNAIGRSLSQIIFGYPTTSDKRQIWQYFNHRCAYCDCQITERSGHLDHLIPISNGDNKHEQDWVLFLTSKRQNLPKSVFKNVMKKSNLGTIKKIVKSWIYIYNKK